MAAMVIGELINFFIQKYCSAGNTVWGAFCIVTCIVNFIDCIWVTIEAVPSIYSRAIHYLRILLFELDASISSLLTGCGFSFWRVGRCEADTDAVFINLKPQTTIVIIFG